MSLVLFYDTETSNMPLFDQPSSDPGQPHLVQIAAALVDTEARRDVASLYLTVRPDDWTIHPEAEQVHMLSAEHCSTVGVPEWLALRAFLELHQAADLRVGHVESFDARIIRIAMKRFVSDAAADAWKLDSAICTHAVAKDKVPELKPKGTGSLAQVYQHYTGLPLVGAHDAYVDMRATQRVYFSMREAGHV